MLEPNIHKVCRHRKVLCYSIFWDDLRIEKIYIESIVHLHYYGYIQWKWDGFLRTQIKVWCRRAFENYECGNWYSVWHNTPVLWECNRSVCIHVVYQLINQTNRLISPCFVKWRVWKAWNRKSSHRIYTEINHKSRVSPLHKIVVFSTKLPLTFGYYLYEK